MKKRILFLFIVLLAGIVAAQFLGYDFLTTYGFLNKYHLQAFINCKIDMGHMFANIVYERGKIFALIFLLTFTPLSKYLGTFLKCLITFSFGIFLWVCFLNFGLVGILVAIIAVFPHGILYIGAVIWLLLLRKQTRYGKTYHAGISIEKEKLLRILMWCMLGMIIVIACFLEASVGFWLLQKFLKIIILKN